MGVSFYVSSLRKGRFRRALIKSLPGNISSLSIDLNGLIHKVLQQVYAYGDFKNEQAAKKVLETSAIVLEDQFHIVFGNELFKLITTINPNDVIVLAVDGVAPFAKITQQRQRRYRAGKEYTRHTTFNTAN